MTAGRGVGELEAEEAPDPHSFLGAIASAGDIQIDAEGRVATSAATGSSSMSIEPNSSAGVWRRTTTPGASFSNSLIRPNNDRFTSDPAHDADFGSHTAAGWGTASASSSAGTHPAPEKLDPRRPPPNDPQLPTLSEASRDLVSVESALHLLGRPNKGVVVTPPVACETRASTFRGRGSPALTVPSDDTHRRMGGGCPAPAKLASEQLRA
mmetsp:Transcript_27572/g.71547  ORF Transcript_27572/g.71547 Transcript_27572/m.71547 type:complete len:210 (+) Transcript_27572:417-1046(+)